eukprot:gnl/Spiro4/8093_TR4264_c0_g1_i1.p1 gnl/Spiro4/8093_TR4264_c0_g1~~gnl/Spiro4/8093_TR4264_c0_g1_i1.p1  ORF type:complete len:178 (+),score=45.88 gnl/Spiro4/8093_TR4264_c0_g1_i1:163-696(+)
MAPKPSQDVLLVLAQIVVLQSLFYIVLGVVLFLVEVLTFFPVTSTAHVLSFSSLRWSESGAFVVFFCFLLAAFLCSWSFVYVVECPRRCFDFASTLYLMHLLLCSIYSSGMGLNWLWVSCMLLCLAITTILSERLCIARKLKDIPLASALTSVHAFSSSGGGAGSSSSSSSSSSELV